jgi:hypothetical protein
VAIATTIGFSPGVLTNTLAPPCGVTLSASTTRPITSVRGTTAALRTTVTSLVSPGLSITSVIVRVRPAWLSA